MRTKHFARAQPSRTPLQFGQGILQLDKISYVNLTDQVYQAIKDRILSQEIEVGARLRDEDLAGRLGVSRTPVREALLRLNREGLVEVVPRSGTRVRTFSEQDLEEIFEVRIALETLAARKATPRLRAEQLSELRRLHEKAEAAKKRRDYGPALEFDREMHRVILESCGNSRLQDMMATINDYVALFRNLGARTPAHRGFTYGHREILRALTRRDADAAARALAAHINVAREQLFRDFQERNLLKAGPESTKRSRRVAAPLRRATEGGGTRPKRPPARPAPRS